MKKFRKGNVVKNLSLVVLVTGPGDKREGYPVFAGIVISRGFVEDWPIGMYSDTWNADAFTKIDIKLSKLIQDSIKNPRGLKK